MANQSRRLFRNFGSARRRECSRDPVAKAGLAGRWMATSAFERNFSRRNAAAFCGTKEAASVARASLITWQLH
jgi:hypothetical protein